MAKKDDDEGTTPVEGAETPWYRSMKAYDPYVRVRCCARQASLVAPVDSTLRSLDRLHSEGRIDELRVHAWPAEVRLGDADPHADAVSLFEEFDAWADRWNVSIKPPFARETRTSRITGKSREILITPVQCLAVYVGGTLAEVFPHSADQTQNAETQNAETYTVADALTLLEDEDIQGVGSRPHPERPPEARSPDVRPVVDPKGHVRYVKGEG